MTTELRPKLEILARNIDRALGELYNKRMGFFLTVFEFGGSRYESYISNAERVDNILECLINQAVRECADKLEQKGHTKNER